MTNEKLARLSGNPHVRHIHDERFDHCCHQTTAAGEKYADEARKNTYRTAHPEKP